MRNPHLADFEYYIVQKPLAMTWRQFTAFINTHTREQRGNKRRHRRSVTGRLAIVRVKKGSLDLGDLVRAIGPLTADGVERYLQNNEAQWHHADGSFLHT